MTPSARWPMTAACLVTMGLCCLPASPGEGQAGLPAGGEVLFTGSDHAAWVVRRSEDGKGLDILARPVGEKWKLVEGGFVGQEWAAVAVERDLHLLLRNPTAHVIFHLDGGQPVPGRNPGDPRWSPGPTALALCGAEDFAKAEGWTLVAVIAGTRAAEPKETQPGVTAPATTSPTGEEGRAPQVSGPADRGRIPTLTVFQYAGGEWTYLTEHRGVEVGAEGKLFAAVAGGELYVLISAAVGQANRLIRYHDEKWQEVSMQGAPAEAGAQGMVPLARGLAIVLGATTNDPARLSLRMALRDPANGKFVVQPVTQDGKPAVWNRSRPPQVARLAETVALLWQDNGKTRFATCDQTGKLLTDEEVEVPRPSGHGERVEEIFLWAVLLGTFVPMILLRPKGPPKPFTLPESLRPANPGKRLLAVLIDLLPTTAIGGMLFPMPELTMEQAKQILLGQQPQPDNLVFAGVAGLILFTAYGIFMELRFGATLGKMIFKMRVIGDEGARPVLREVLLRNLWKIIELLVRFGIPILPLFILLNRNRQRVGDWLARTAVVDARPSAPPPAPPPPPPDEGHQDPFEPTQGDD